MDQTTSVFHKTLDTIAIIGNFLVLAFILQNWLILKSCKAQSYRALIMNLAALDMLAAISDMLVQSRVVHYEDKVLFISNGPCSKISSWACAYCTEFLLHLYSYGIWGVFMSYVYRYLVLTKGPVRHIHLAISVLCFYTLSVIQMFLMNFSVKVDDEVIEYLEIKYPMQNFPRGPGNAYYGFSSVYDFNLLLVILHLTIPVFPLLVTEFILGVKVYGRLNRDKEYLSANTQELHWQLLKALICQTSLPILWLLGVIGFFFSRNGVLPDSFSEYSSSSLFIIIPVLGPIFNIWFIKSFRHKIMNWFKPLRRLFKKRGAEVSSVTYPTGSTLMNQCTQSNIPMTVDTNMSVTHIEEIKQ